MLFDFIWVELYYIQGAVKSTLTNILSPVTKIKNTTQEFVLNSVYILRQ